MVLSKDKQLHFVAGFVIATLSGLVGGPTLAALATVSAGVGKELYDKYSGKGTPEVADAAATILGGLLPILYML